MDIREIINLTKENKIKYFFKEYFFLSNFYKSPVEIDGIVYKTNEHYFQSMKTIDEKERHEIINSQTPGMAKALGRECTLVENWEEIKDSIMRKCLFAKFSQNEKLKKRLLDTGDMILEEGNYWNDRYWGVDLDGNGKNMLGKLLMETRKELTKNK